MNDHLRLFAILLMALVSPNAARPSQDDCSAQISQAGFDLARFAPVIAHGVHSLTVEDLRLFKPDVTDQNRVPGVNQDMTVAEPLLENAPFADLQPGGTFKSYGMQLLDRVFSNMDRKEYDSGLDTIERVFHAFHMAEYWQRARVEYKKLVDRQASKDICPCLLNTDANGVTEALRNVSKDMRNHDYIQFCIYCGRIFYADTEMDFNRDGVPVKPSTLPPLPKLNSSANWVQWKKFYTPLYMIPEDDRALAYFLYCALES